MYTCMCDCVTLLCSEKLTEHCKSAIMEKIKIIKKKPQHEILHICNLHHSSQQCQIFNPLSEARDRTHVLMDAGWVH